MTQKRILVFGVFDRLHEGHIHFLLEAKKLGEHLIVAVAQDSAVKRLKGKEPQLSLEKRSAQLRRLEFVNEVIAGDESEGGWGVVKLSKPDVIALGYDQNELKKALAPLAKEWRFTLKVLAPYEPDKFHSSLLN